MNKKYYLGIDTSNYTTSVAAIDEDGNLFFDVRDVLSVGNGERGMRQSQALFNHVNNLPDVICGVGRIAAEKGLVLGGVGVSSKPRPVEGSYMPCFLPGVSAGAAIAEVNNVPLFKFSHQEGHLAAALSGNEELINSEKAFAAYHLSGGTTEILLCRGTEIIDIVGGTKDISLGKLIDRTGVAMGLKFPCGKEMDGMAMTCRTDIINPFCKIKTADGLMNVSGIETQIQNFISAHEGLDKALISGNVLSRCAEAIIDSIHQISEKYDIENVLFMGGVSSSSFIKTKLISDFIPAEGRNTVLYFGRERYCPDNAVGIAILARSRCPEK